MMLKYLSDKGHITGLDISGHMEKQFLQKFYGDMRVDLSTVVSISRLF